MNETQDLWHTTCEVLARRANQRVARQIPPPTDRWDAWCREMERREEFLYDTYFPTASSGIAFIGIGSNRFSHESEHQAAWRDASNRMKRYGELWQRHAESVADKWGRWCTAKAINGVGERSFRIQSGKRANDRTER
jgi:hypothetical protein